MRCPVVRCPALCCSALLVYAPLVLRPWYCVALHYAALHYAALQYGPLNYAALHCAALQQLQWWASLSTFQRGSNSSSSCRVGWSLSIFLLSDIFVLRIKRHEKQLKRVVTTHPHRGMPVGVPVWLCVYLGRNSVRNKHCEYTAVKKNTTNMSEYIRTTWILTYN